MVEITQANKGAFASMFFGGLVDRTLCENGVPNWLRAADPKILAIRANLDEPPILFGFAGWLTNKQAVSCSMCAALVEPNSTLYLMNGWKPRCEACEAKRVEDDRRRDAEYQRKKHDDMLRRVAAARERCRLRNLPDPRQCALFGAEP